MSWLQSALDWLLGPRVDGNHRPDSAVANPKRPRGGSAMPGRIVTGTLPKREVELHPCGGSLCATLTASPPVPCVPEVPRPAPAWHPPTAAELRQAREVVAGEPLFGLPALITTSLEMSHRYTRPEQRAQCIAKVYAACERLETELAALELERLMGAPED